MAVASDLYEPRALARKSWVDDKNFVGVRRIRSVISDWEIERAVNAHSPGTDPRENAEYCDDLCDAVNAEVDAAIAAGDPPFGACRLFDTLPQPLQPEKRKDCGNCDSALAKARRADALGGLPRGLGGGA